ARPNGTSCRPGPARRDGRAGVLLAHVLFTLAGPALTLLPQQTPLLARPVALLLGLALVVQLLAAGERELDLCTALVVEIELERHQRHALALDRADQLVDLPFVQQQLARALRRMIEAPGLQILGDVGVDQPELAAARIRIGLGDRGFARAQRLHLAAGERDAGLELLADLVVEARLAVLGDGLVMRILLRRHRDSRLPEADGRELLQRLGDAGERNLALVLVDLDGQRTLAGQQRKQLAAHQAQRA